MQQLKNEGLGVITLCEVDQHTCYRRVRKRVDGVASSIFVRSETRDEGKTTRDKDC